MNWAILDAPRGWPRGRRLLVINVFYLLIFRASFGYITWMQADGKKRNSHLALTQAKEVTHGSG